MRTLTVTLLALFAGISRADTFAYVSLAKDRKIAVYKVEPTTGALTHVADAPCEGEPGALVANPAGSHREAQPGLPHRRIPVRGTLSFIRGWTSPTSATSKVVA